MTTLSLAEIEKQIEHLSMDEQLTLIETLAGRLRRASSQRSTGGNDLAAMAADPDIQREIRTIEEEFRGTESDGLE